MLESFRKGQRWLTLIFVASIGGVFIFFFGSGGAVSAPLPPRVMRSRSSTMCSDDARLQRVSSQREQMLREQLGDAYAQPNADQIVASQSPSSS